MDNGKDDDAFEIIQRRSPVGKSVRKGFVHHTQLIAKRRQHYDDGNQVKFAKWNNRVEAYEDMKGESSLIILKEYEEKNEIEGIDRKLHADAWYRLMLSKATG